MSAAPPKTKLRARMRALRRALARQTPDAAERAAALAPLGRLPACQVIASYHPQGAELDPAPLVRALLARAPATVVFPAGEDRDHALLFRAGTPGEADAFGVPAPRADAPVHDPDLVIAPLLAFDASGARMGQGAGAYDRTIENLRGRRRVFVLGLAYSGQEIDEIPAEPHDQRLDGVLTETGYTEF